MATRTIREMLPTNTIAIRYVQKLNGGYIKTLRGVLNACQVGLSVVSLGIMAHYCQFFIGTDRNVGFICPHPDTCFLVICCINFVISILVFVCCIVSADTTDLLSRTLLLPVSYLLCLLLTFGSSVALLIHVIRRNVPYAVKEEGFDGVIVAAAFGLLNCCLYGASFVVFCLKKK